MGAGKSTGLLYKSLKYSLIPMATWAGVITHRVDSCVSTGQDDVSIWFRNVTICS